MQDDCYLIAADGWKAETYRIIETDKKGKQKDKGWTCDLIPKAIIVARYFAKEQETIDQITAELDKRAYAQYPKLTEDEIKTLVVDDKWLAALDAMIHGEMDRISQTLTQRVKELAELYETPMPQLSSRAADREAKVYRHLEKMGFSLS